MIRFFRKIRQGLLSENKYVKYTFYALGEISLVVIGILIALYVDNNNQRNQNEERIKVLLKEALFDLDDFILNGEVALNIYHDKQKKFQLILDEKNYSDSSILENWEQVNYETCSFFVWEKERFAYDILVNNPDLIPDNYRAVVNKLRNFYVSSNFEKMGAKIEETANKNFKKRYDYKWIKAQESRDQKLMIIKNEVDYFQILVGWYCSNIISDIIYANEVRNSIEDFMGLPKTKASTTFEFDTETKIILIGQWKNDDDPEAIWNVFEEGNQLNHTDRQDSMIKQLFSLGNNEYVTTDGDFMALKKVGDEYVQVHINGTIFRKVEE